MSSEPRARGGFPVFKLGLIALVSYCGMEAARGIYHIRNPDCPAAAPGDAPDARVRALKGCLETSRGERGATFHAPVWGNRGSGTRFYLYLVEYGGDAWLRLVAATDLTRRPPWDTVFVQADGRELMELPFAADQLERVRPDSSRQVADVRVPDTLVSRLRLMPEAASVPVTFNRNNTTHVLTTREQRGFADVLELYDLLRRRPPQPAEAAPAPDTARP